MPLPTARPLLNPTLLAAMVAALLGTSAASRAAPAADEPMLPYTVTTRDTLIGLNRTLFAVPGAWQQVARINRLPDPNRIWPGEKLLVPVRLLRSQVIPAQLVSAFGDVRIAGRPAATGDAFNVGDAISTGAASTAVVQLADGSHIKLAPDTEGRLDEHRRFQLRATRAAVDDGLVAGTLRLVRGSIEVFATKVLRARPLEITTPSAVIGVRGTSYRVRNDVIAATAGTSEVNESATEVLEGKVHAQVGTSAAQSADVPANFGAPLADGRKPVVLPLPPAPDLSAMPAQADGSTLHFVVPGGTPVRVQVAADAAFDHIVADLHVAPDAEVSVPALADGTWHLRARRISPEGLEGLDAVRTFQVLGLPETPFLVEPAAGAKRRVGDVPLRWTASPGAASYVVEAARDPGFTQISWHAENLVAPQAVLEPQGNAYGAADGVYYWRVAGVSASGRRGAWGDTQVFVLRPTPRWPMGHVSPDGSSIELMWGGRAEDRVQVELARDPAYREVVEHAEFSAPQGRLARPRPGTYYAHYRFVEPDGFATAWSGDVKIVVESDWRRAWR